MKTREEQAFDAMQESIELGRDKLLSAEQLDEKYNPDGDGEHPVFTRDEWRDAVGNQDTISGYWDWVYHRLTQ